MLRCIRVQHGVLCCNMVCCAATWYTVLQQVGNGRAGSNVQRIDVTKLEFASSWSGKTNGAMVVFARAAHSSDPIRVKILPRSILKTDVAASLEALVLLTKKLRQSSHAVRCCIVVSCYTKRGALGCDAFACTTGAHTLHRRE